MQFNNLLEQIKTHPNQTLCVVNADGSEVEVTFGAFASAVDNLIERLKAKDIQPGMRVGLLGNNSYDWMVWDIALLTIGCISVAFPVDNFEKTDENLIKKYQLSYLAVSDQLGFNTSEITRGIAPLELDSTQQWYEAAIQAVIEPEANIHSMVFSSGTTGHLKGLTISDMGTENLVTLFENAFGFQNDDKHLIFLPFSGYQQRMVYYGCLYYGAGIAVVPYLRLFHELRNRKPSFVIAPPMFFETIQKLTKRPTKEATVKAIATILGGNIRAMITGMAAIKRDTLDYFWDHDISLFEAYGITEAGMVAWNKPALHKVGTLGHVAEPNTVELGEGNEIIICRDKPLSLGYFEASEDDSRHTFPEKNRVATGDIGAFDDDGFLSIVGRKKDIIVTKTGEKFHPEPIEVMLNNCRYIDTGVVLGGDGIPGVVAMLNLTEKGDEVDAVVKQHIDQLNKHLSDYQKITKTVVVDKAFTLENGFRTQNLKLHRKSIRQYYEQQA